MSLQSAQIDWDAPAKLYVIPRSNETFIRGGPVHEGTLASCVMRFQALRPEEYEDASIGFEVGVIHGKDTGLIGISEIQAIAARADFPN